jgi:transposase
MKRNHFIGLDVHCQFTEMAVVSQTGQVTKRQRCATTIPELVAALEAVPRFRHVVFEEGPLADWLWRNLAGHADEVIVCDPRRNHLIAKDSDKDDAIDAEKLGQLLRGGYLKAVHHAESLERAVFKQHIALYHDGVRQRVRSANRIGALLRRHGLFVAERDFQEAEQRRKLLERLPPSRLLRRDVQLLWHGYDVTVQQALRLRKRLVELARQQEVIRRFVQLPGVRWIRASTFYAYVDTPWRFASKQGLWKYLGIGLERRHSGAGPARVQLAHRANRCLKDVILGAAQSAVRAGKNPFADQYRRWINQGIIPRVALRNTARSLAATLWGMWKNGSAYHPQWVGVAAAASAAKGSATASVRF